MNYPRVLVVAPVKFNRQAGGGVTMGNLFRGWPRDRIAQVHCDDWSAPDTSVCEQYRYYTARDPLFRPRSLRNLRSCIRNVLCLWRSDASGMDAFLDSEKLLEWSRVFCPDVIYIRTQDEPRIFWWLGWWLANRLGVPYVTHTMDDWPARFRLVQGGKGRVFRILMMERSLRRLFRQSAANMSISDEMGCAFRRRYGVRFQTFRNCLDLSDWPETPKNYRCNETFRIVYIGAVTPDKELGSLLDVRDVLLDLKNDGIDVELVIHTAEPWAPIVERQIALPPTVRYGGFVSHDKLPGVLRAADLLLLPLNFDALSKAYMGHSFQTKVSEYMASGTPALIYGPEWNPNVKYAIEGEWGWVVSRKDAAALKQALSRLINDETLRIQLGKRGRELALLDHNASATRKRFNIVLNNASTVAKQMRSG